MAETTDISPQWSVVTIGRGSFASVLFSPVTLSRSSMSFCHELQREFDALRSIYNTDSIFAIPKPIAFYHPGVPASFVAPVRPPKNHRRPHRPCVNEGDFKILNLGTAAYAMDHVSPLPLVVADTIRKLFYPPSHPPLGALHSVGFTSRLAETGGQIASLTRRTSLWMSLGTG